VITAEISKLIALISEPSLGLTVNDMGINTKVEYENNEINIHLEIGFPSAHLHKSLIQAIKTKLTMNYPNQTFNISLEQIIKSHQTQLPGKGLRGVKNVIAVASGKGGVGKSTLAVNMATSLASAGARVGLLDADIYGPSIPLMLGDTSPLKISGDKYLPINTHGIQAMSIGYLTQGESALIWRGPMLAKSLIQMLDITLWDDLDYLFIDLPPGTGDIQLSLVQKIPLSGAVIVTTPQNVATLDAEKAIKMFDKTSIHNIGVIENMSQYICSNCGHTDTIFGHGGAKELSETFGCNFLGNIPLDRNIGKDCDNGTPSSIGEDSKLADAFMRVSLLTAIGLNKRPLNYAEKFPPILATTR
jgi:ATP-binding protein involved in chromosome partitioning